MPKKLFLFALGVLAIGSLSAIAFQSSAQTQTSPGGQAAEIASGALSEVESIPPPTKSENQNVSQENSNGNNLKTNNNKTAGLETSAPKINIDDNSSSRDNQNENEKNPDQIEFDD